MEDEGKEDFPTYPLLLRMFFYTAFAADEMQRFYEVLEDFLIAWHLSLWSP